MVTYDKVAKHYIERRSDKTRFDYNRDIEVPALVKIIGNATGKTILDIGCGFGDHAKILSRQKFKSLIGFDISKDLVNHANGQKIPNCRFYIGDMDKKLKHENSSFDIVYSGLAIHYSKNLDKLFKEIHRVLKKNGTFCFSTGHPIFNLLNQTDEHIICSKKISETKREIVGDYFDESFRLNDLGSLGKVSLRNFTFETMIKTGLSNGFELVDYADAKPIRSSRKFPEKYRLTTIQPTFILFKFRKK